MKQFETFGEYMFDLLFAPLKKGRKTVNQLCIFFKVMGREFDDLKASPSSRRAWIEIFSVQWAGTSKADCRPPRGGRG